MRCVQITWRDAHAKLDYITVADALKVGPAVTHAVGWLVAESAEGYVIAVDRCDDEADTYRNHHFICRESVVRVADLVAAPIGSG